MGDGFAILLAGHNQLVCLRVVADLDVSIESELFVPWSVYTRYRDLDVLHYLGSNRVLF